MVLLSVLPRSLISSRLPLMSNSSKSPRTRSSGLSKTGVVKRGRVTNILFLKATVILIFLSDVSIKIVKCSRY